jgi:hypothetical protein
MKKLTLLMAFCVFLAMLNASLLLEDNFTGEVGTLLTANGWTNHSGTSNFIPIVGTDLFYPGYSSSGGGSASLLTSGEDVNRAFTSQNAGGVYASLLINVSAAQAGGDYFFHFSASPISTSFFRGKVFIQKDATSNNFRFGLTNTGAIATAVTTGYDYVYGTTYLIVLKYEFVAGSNNDLVHLWVNPVFSPEPTPLLTSTDAITSEPVSIGTIALRQGGATAAPTLLVDGIRVGTSWSDIFPTLATEPTAQPTNLQFGNVTSTTFDVSFTAASPTAEYYLAVRKAGSAPTSDPVDGTGYTIGQVLGDGTVAYSGSGTAFSESGLDPSTTYYYNIYSFNGTGSAANYLITGPLQGSQATSAGVALPTVTTAAISSITYNSAWGGGNVTDDGGDTVTARGVCWNIAGLPTIDDDFTDDGNGTGEFTSFIDGIAENQLYHVRAYATNSAGTAYGEEVTFTTLKGEPTNHVDSFAAGSPTFTTLTVTWTDAAKTAPDGYLIKGSDVGFAAIVDPIDGVPEVNSLLVHNVNQGVGNYVFTALYSGTNYFFKIYPYTNSGSNINFKTDAPVPQTQAQTLPYPEVPGLIAYWNFNEDVPATGNWTQPYPAQIGDGELTYTFANVVNFTGTVLNVPFVDEIAGGSFVPQGGAGNVNNGCFFILDVPTTGYENIIFSYATRGTATGFNTQTVLFSYNGEDFNEIATYTGTNTTSWSVKLIDFSAITGVNNNPNFKIMIIVNGATSESGNNRFDNITFFGEETGTVPVELSSFTAVLTAENFVKLSWTTQTETNVQGYYIYRASSDALENAILISSLVEATNTSEEHTYRFTDSELFEEGTYYYWLQNVDFSGSTEYHGPVSVVYSAANEGVTPEIPQVTGLKDIYPNPFNPTAIIPFSIAKTADVQLMVYNSRGQLLRHVNFASKAPGNYQFAWDGKDANGAECGSGVYYFVLQAGKDSFQRKAVLQK